MRYKYIKIKKYVAGWYYIYCPQLEKPNTFGTLRTIYKELKLFEKILIDNSPAYGWIANTKKHHSKMLKIFHKLGAIMYDETGDNIWFMKILRAEEI